MSSSTVLTNTIYLVRHGENPANLTKEFSYRLVDYPLNAKGLLQARQTADFFRGLPIDAIYASPLRRARQTAEIIAEALCLPVTLLEEFREINVGDLERRPPTVEHWKLHDQIIADWYSGHYLTRFPNGENFLELLQRIRQGLHKVIAGQSGRRIIIAGHGGIFTVLVKALCYNADRAPIYHGAMDNCAITEIELHAFEEVLVGSLRLWASTAHLSGQAAELVPGQLQYAEKPTVPPVAEGLSAAT
ncbi:histidine phosphatase family protein [Thermogemmatispora sp.]|uniref:histidine phosphatase family protein n=1 Tax=Thermogemmatispora sp. TaxID=1968838 RepID=UPI001DF3FCE0|nr:histidine phosphatase family protein [Thermogemmatispora sp.]MBX5449533.1 histidine phosphatase family protein [Thermogemmatispora sp.]